MDCESWHLKNTSVMSGLGISCKKTILNVLLQHSTDVVCLIAIHLSSTRTEYLKSFLLCSVWDISGDKHIHEGSEAKFPVFLLFLRWSNLSNWRFEP